MARHDQARLWQQTNQTRPSFPTSIGFVERRDLICTSTSYHCAGSMQIQTRPGLTLHQAEARWLSLPILVSICILVRYDDAHRGNVWYSIMIQFLHIYIQTPEISFESWAFSITTQYSTSLTLPDPATILHLIPKSRFPFFVTQQASS